MLNNTLTTLADEISEAAYPLTGQGTDFDPLIDWIDAARLVLTGEVACE